MFNSLVPSATARNLRRYIHCVSIQLVQISPTVRPNYVGIKVNLSSIILKLQTQIYLINFWVIVLKPHDKK